MDMNPVTLRAERKLRMLDSRVLSDLFVSKRQKVAENCTKFRDKALHDSQISSSIISHGTSRTNPFLALCLLDRASL